MRCIVSGCDVDSSCPSTSKGVTFLRFPTETTLCESWLKALQKQSWEVTRDSVVCSKHFQKDDLYMSREGKWNLRPGAIPIVYMQNKSERDKWMMPCDLKVCRICFATDCNLYAMRKYKNLDEAYETLTGLSIANNDSLPSYLCTECSRRLLNCIQFRTKTIQANLILHDIIQEHDYLSLEAIKSCDGYQLLSSSLGVTYKHHYDLEIKHVEKRNTTDEQEHIDGSSSLYVVNIIKVEKGEETNRMSLEDQETCYNSTYPPRLHEVTVPGIKLEREDHDSPNHEDNTNNYKGLPTLQDTMGVKVKVETIDMSGQDCIDNNAGYIPCGDGPFGEAYPPANVFLEELQKVKHRPQSHTKTHTGKKSHIKMHSDKKLYSCDECKKVFSKKYNLIIHLRTHSGVKPYSCDLCKQGFSLKCDLVNHLRKHSGEKPYACDICKKTFILRNVLQAHLRTHTGEKPYVCKVCNKAFSQRANLSAHIKTHSGEKPYSCDICKKGFSQRCNLITHSRTHSGEKPYSCNLCTISFSRNYHLKSHLNVHSGEKPHICDVCKKAFTSQSNLQKHMTVHSGVKPYSCNVCNKAFNRKGNLNTHIKTHSNEKPYLCVICNKAFRRKDQLKIHSKVHSSEKSFDVNILVDNN